MSGVSLNPKNHVNDSDNGYELNKLMASLSLSDFIQKHGKKLLENSNPDDWFETSFRPHIRGLLPRYDTFCNECGVSVFSVLRMVDRHWLAFCNTHDGLNSLRKEHSQVSSQLYKSPYSDLMEYKGNIPDLFLGRVCGSTINIKCHRGTYGELHKYANALQIKTSYLIELGRAWALSTEPDAKDWSDLEFQPLFDALMQRSKEMLTGLQEAFHIMRYRKGWRGDFK